MDAATSLRRLFQLVSEMVITVPAQGSAWDRVPRASSVGGKMMAVGDEINHGEPVVALIRTCRSCGAGPDQRADFGTKPAH